MEQIDRCNKIGLIVEGGGMKCAYSAGVLDSFLDDNIQFDYCMGVSAGAANVASFVAGQRDRNRRFYCIHVKDPNYISIRNFIRTGSLFGLQYIYGDMTNEGGIDPLDYDALRANPAEMCFPATDAETGKVRYFTKKDMKRNQYEPVMATCALPALCKPIEIDGHYYYDGGVGDSIPVRKAVEDGCEKLIVILSKPRGYRMKPQGHRLAYTKRLKEFPNTAKALDHRHENYNASLDYLYQMEREGKAMIFAPSGEVKIGTYTTDPAVMQALYDNGLEDGQKMHQQVKFFIHTQAASKAI